MINFQLKKYKVAHMFVTFEKFKLKTKETLKCYFKIEKLKKNN